MDKVKIILASNHELWWEGLALLIKYRSKDIEVLLIEIEENGGKTVLPKTELPGGHGHIGRFRDPFGNLMGLWSEE